MAVIRRRPAEVEIVTIPDIGLDEPPATDEFAVRREVHACSAKSLGSRARL
jgi:hypothetical protein